MNNAIDIALTLLCISIPIGILVASAILGIRARKRYAIELKRKLDNGYFKNWSSKPLVSNRLKIIAAIQIIALTGMLIDLLMWFYYQSQAMRIALACILGILVIILVVSGLVMMKLLRDVHSQ
jgi:uncharacterized membrane protein YbaN (DUF454 family)